MRTGLDVRRFTSAIPDGPESGDNLRKLRMLDGCRSFAVDRRTMLGGGLGSALLLSSGISFSSPMATPVSRIGLGATSFSDQLFIDGFAFTDGKRKARTTAELQRMMMAHGGNEVFTRLGTSRMVVGRRRGSGIAAALVRAALARSVGLPLNPELLLCAHYGDMAGQPEPDFSGFPELKLSRPWHELALAEMCEAMRIYGRLTAREILGTGVRVNVWDIGNEVEFGIAGVAMPPMVPTIGGADWHYKAPDNVDPEIGKMTLGRFFTMAPPEQVAWGKAHLWPYVGRIMAAVAEGIREVDPKAVFATHASAIASLMPEVFVGFYEAVDAAGFRTRDLGVSYYPTNTKLIHDRFALFKKTASTAMQRLGRPIYIAEFGYAAGPVTYGGQDWANPVDGYPCTPKGQADFLRDLTEWGVRSGMISGIRPWAPDFVGSTWQGMALFEAPKDGVSMARPALFAIQQGKRLARRGRRS
jgi:arabinogalactan endo-1,4-beta-galactosidase